MGAIIKRGTKERPRFYLRYVDADGTRRMKAAKGATQRQEARAMLNAIERNIFEGKVGVPKPVAPDPEAEKRRTITVEQIGNAFLEKFRGPRIKNLGDYIVEARSVLTVRVYPALGKRVAASVTSYDVEQLRDELAEEYAPQSVSNTLNTISKVFGWAKKQGLIDCDSPVRGVERPRTDVDEPITADKYLTKLEAAELLGAAEALQVIGVASVEGMMLYPMVATALFAGLRKGELYGLRWPAIDFERGQIEVSRSYDGKPKSGRTRHVPLAPKLSRILRLWRDSPMRPAGVLVFPVEGRMGRSDETLGLGQLMMSTIEREPPKVWHSLRHSFAAHLVMSGANILTVSKLLGHADVKTTLIYAHLAPDFMAAEVARLSYALPAPAGVADIADARRKGLMEMLDRDPEALFAALDQMEEAHVG